MVMHIVETVYDDGGHETACGWILYEGDGADLDDNMCDWRMYFAGWEYDLREDY
jgi:hypothetical protein